VERDRTTAGDVFPEAPKIVVIAGPTASGKTEVAIALAQRFRGEVVSADSVQVYRWLDVGSAKPTPHQRSLVPHHMIDIVDPDEEFSAGDYVRDARRAVAAILRRGNLPLVVGGTGLYIRFLLGGAVEAPPRDEGVRQSLLAQEMALGSDWLHQKLMDLDPAAAHAIGPNNRQRILRALEVCLSTRTRFSELQQSHGFRDRPYRVAFLCIAPPRPILYERIDRRAQNMVREGLCDEVRMLLERGYGRELKSMQTLGYRHAAMILAGETDLDEAVRLLKRDTRRYAKRQLTWFRSEPGARWFDPGDLDGMGSAVAHFLEQ
jgi:tRNA dimethylallyltransferase